MQTTTRKVQTAFRLDPDLLGRMKRKAKAKGKSLNAIVEETLNMGFPKEPEWPRVEIPKEISPEIKALQITGCKPFSREEVENDPKLEYFVEKYNLPVEGRL